MEIIVVASVVGGTAEEQMRAAFCRVMWWAKSKVLALDTILCPHGCVPSLNESPAPNPCAPSLVPISAPTGWKKLSGTRRNLSNHKHKRAPVGKEPLAKRRKWFAGDKKLHFILGTAGWTTSGIEEGSVYTNQGAVIQLHNPIVQVFLAMNSFTITGPAEIKQQQKCYPGS